MTWNNGSYWGTSASTTMIYPVTYTNTSATIAVGGSYAPPAPRAPTALEWLDSEVESTCARARG